MLKRAVEGYLVDVTDSHFVTKNGEGTQLWHKDYYRLVQEVEPQTEVKRNDV